MVSDVDDRFYERADAHIDLSNTQLKDIGAGKVSASMMYANARFAAWISATWCADGEEMTRRRADSIDFFVTQFRLMLEENYDDYNGRFDAYIHGPA